MMKRISILMVVICLQVFFIQSAMADVDPTPPSGAGKATEKAKSHKWVYFAALPIYYFGVQIPLHEGGHAFAGWLNPHYQVDNFKPWPHLINGGPHFVLGSVDIICASERACADKTGLGLISLAPYITDTLLFTAADSLLATNAVRPTSIGGRVLYFAGMVVPWWDFSANATIWANKRSDANYIAVNFGIPRWSVMATGMSVSAVGVWRLWEGYKRAFYGHQAKESNLVITPISNSKTIGVSAYMRF